MLFLAATLLLAASPFDDLTAAEIKVTTATVRADKQFGDSVRFPIIVAKEPPKAVVLAWRSGGALPPREALAATYDPVKNRFCEVTVDLAAKKVSGVRELANQQPPILLDEYADAAKLTKADVRWQEAMKKRGIKDMDSVYVDGWVAGLLSDGEAATGKRLMRALSYLQGKGTNFYARPIEGVLVTIDLNERKVIEVADSGIVPFLENEGELPKSQTNLRSSVQPSAPIVVSGQRIQWRGWSLRYSMQPHKGLVIYDVSFTEPGQQPRAILYKGALAEMVVPYGDPTRAWSFRNAFDVGEYGLGRTAHALEARTEAPDGARFFSAAFADDDGKPFIIPHAVAVYERDAGLLWSHVDMNSRKGAAQRARELVVSFMTTIGNYDYGIDWVFTLDGTIKVEANLTGMLLAQGTAMEENTCTADCKRLVAKRIIAPNHQHFFSFRLDMDVDGADGNTPVEVNVSAAKAGTPSNPDNNGFDAALTPLRKESAAARDLQPASARVWKITSTKAHNALGHPTGYMLMPGETATPYLDKASSKIRARAGFIEHNVWFTRYKDDEQSSGGDYPNQSKGGDGLPRFIADDESLEGTDVVLWYTFGVTHIPRPEEWPVMNVHHTGFKLMPHNFFSRNPTIK
jgi:primary-amine oxidase